MLLGVVLATLVSFAVSAIILKFTKEPKQDLEAATAQMEATKGKKSSVSSKLSSKENNQQASTTGATAGATSTEESNNSEDDADQLLDNYNTEDVDAHDYSNVNHVIFACDAGMGSSAMGASMLRNKFKKLVFDVNVTNTAINQLPNDAQLVITQKH